MKAIVTDHLVWNATTGEVILQLENGGTCLGIQQPRVRRDRTSCDIRVSLACKVMLSFLHVSHTEMYCLISVDMEGLDGRFL